ncbi:hypothetical protein CONPUDRAFT_20808, partial [Coniophora puteana RWD-64-598 SS2]
AMQRSAGKLVTLQTDGWTGINSHHLVAFMMTTSPNHDVHTVAVKDVSSDRCTAAHLKNLIINVISKVKPQWQATVVAVTSATLGESRAARKQLLEQFPLLVTPDWYTHQINLVVGDYLKANNAPTYLSYTKKVTELITWLQNHSQVTALLQRIQEQLNQMCAALERILSVIRAVLTCWTAHYLVFCWLLRLRSPLFQLAEQSSGWMLAQGAAKAKAQEMVNLIKDKKLWEVLEMEPLMYAANFSQTTHTHLDKILLVFGYLHFKYTNMPLQAISDGEQSSLLGLVIKSLERHWAKCDQQVFISAVILNSIYKLTPFAKSPSFLPANIFELMCLLYECFFGSTTPASLYDELNSY